MWNLLQKLNLYACSLVQEEEDEKDKANREQSKLTQEDINRMMVEGKVRLLLPNFIP